MVSIHLANSHLSCGPRLLPESHQFGYKDTLERLDKVKVNNMTYSPHVQLLAISSQRAIRLVIAFGKPTFLVPKDFPIFHVFGNGFQEDLLHKLPGIEAKSSL